MRENFGQRAEHAVVRRPSDRPADAALARPDALTAAEFAALGAVPPELEWFANLHNAQTRRAYRRDVQDFAAFAGLHKPEDFRKVARAHLIAWRQHLEGQKLAPSTIRRKLAALSSLFDYLCERDAVAHNPADGVKRPKASHGEGLTPALSDAQARALLDAPPEGTLKGLRDRAILVTLLFHGLRRDELCKLKVADLHPREGVLHLKVNGKGGKIRFLPVAFEAARRIDAYLRAAGHRSDSGGALFRPGDPARSQQLMTAIDHINARMGRGTVRFATEGFGHGWAMRQAFRSPAYTTRWGDLPQVR